MVHEEASGPASVGSRRVGRPAVLSREQILAAVATFDDVDGLTMRELARRLGVGHPALYRWVENRDAVFDLVSQVVVDRVLADLEAEPTGATWQRRLQRLADAMREHILAVPGYALHLARPHVHHAHSADRLRAAGVAVFREAGASPAMAEQSWLVFVTAVIGWLAVEERPAALGGVRPRFDLFVGVLLRGLPTTPAWRSRTARPVRPET